MKRNTFAGAILLMMALSLASCERTQENGPRKEKEPPVSVQAEFQASFAPVKGAFSTPVFTWTAGDRVCTRISDKQYPAPDASDVFHVPEDGPEAVLSGEMEYARDRDIVACTFSQGGFTDKDRPIYSGSVPQTQSGRPADIRPAGFFSARINRKDITLEDGTCRFSASLSPLFALVRLSIPEDLAAETMTLDADASIAGSFSLDLQDYLLSREAAGRISRITVRREGETLAGNELFLMLAPDAYDAMTGTYYSSATILTLTFYDKEGRVDRYAVEPDGRLLCGTLTDLGEVPDYISFDKPAVSGYLKLLEENQVRIGVADTSLMTTFHYEIGLDEQSCPNPTADGSPAFYACKGFEVPCSHSHDAWFVKVLMHSESHYANDVILKGYVRNWNFGEDTPVAAAAARAASLVPAVGNIYDVDGMVLYRTNSKALDYVQYPDRMQIRTCYLAMNATACNNAEGWLYFKVNRRIARGYKLYNDNATYGTTTFNGYPVTASVTRDTSAPESQVPIVWRLGTVTEGYMFAVRGDGYHDYYNMAFLETGPDIAAPTRPTTDLSLKFMDNATIPVLALDTTAVAVSLEAGARYHFITSRKGFDDMGDPTVHDAILGQQGIVVPIENASDRLYVKVLGHCDGREDSFLRAVVRNWKFDKNFVAPTGLSSDYDGMHLKLSTSYSNDMVTYPRVGYLGVAAGTAAVTPLTQGEGWVYANQFAGSFNGTTFSISNDGRQIYKIAMPGATYYHENSVKTSVPSGPFSPESTILFDWTYKVWLKDFAFLEETRYTPSSHADGGSGTGIEGFDGNTDY